MEFDKRCLSTRWYRDFLFGYQEIQIIEDLSIKKLPKEPLRFSGIGFSLSLVLRQKLSESISWK